MMVFIASAAVAFFFYATFIGFEKKGKDKE